MTSNNTQPPADAAGLYRFDGHELDTAQRELRHDGVIVEVQPRVFDLLVYLVTHRDRVVDKDELQDAVWPGRVITETALTRAVMKARKAVGDDASRQGVIKTLHGHGYRFIAAIDAADPVVALPASVVPAAQDEASAVSPRSRWFSWGVPGLALVTLLLTWSWFNQDGPRAGDYRIAVLPVVDETGDAGLEWARLGIMSFVSGMFESDGQLRTVADSSTMQLADNLEWSGDPEDESGSRIRDRLARNYGASHVLALTLAGEPPTLRLDYRLYTPEGGLYTGSMVGEQVSDLAQGVVQGVYGDVLGRFRERPETQAIADDPFLNEAWARGMALTLEGRCEDAQSHYEVIIEAEPALFQPRYELALCLRILGENEQAEEALTALVDEQRDLGVSRELGMSLMALGVLMNRTGRLEAAETAHQEALQVATEVEDHDLRGMVYNNLAIVAEDRHELDQAEDYMSRALLAYEEAGRESPPGQAWSALANIAMARRELDRADEYQSRALEAFREVGDRRQEAMMISNTGFLRRLQGRLDEAEILHLEALRIREEIGDRVGVGRMYNMLAIIANTRGNYDEAVDYATQSLEVMREVGDVFWEAVALSNLADAERYLGAYESAAQHYMEVRDLFVQVEDPMRTLQAELKMSRLAEIRGHWDDTEQVASAVLEKARAGGYEAPEIQAMELMGDAAYGRSDYPLAVTRYGLALERVREMQWQSKETTLLVKLADTFLDLGDLASAEPLVGELTQLEPTIHALKARARFANLRGNHENAVAWMLEAKEMAGEHWTDDSEAALQSYQAAVP